MLKTDTFLPDEIEYLLLKIKACVPVFQMLSQDEDLGSTGSFPLFDCCLISEVLCLQSDVRLLVFSHRSLKRGGRLCDDGKYSPVKVMIRQMSLPHDRSRRFGTASVLLARIVSGGQTGVDRAALDVAMGLGLPCGGWCPRGRKAEDGPIAPRYPLKETISASYRVRTERNVRDSDAVLILTWGPPREGTALTQRLAEEYGKPCFVVDLSLDSDPETVRAWLKENEIGCLDIAGPRESQFPGIYEKAALFLRGLFSGQPD